MHKALSFIHLIILSLFLFSSHAKSQESLDAEMRESIEEIQVTVRDMYSRSETKPVIVTIFRPPVEGKSPLLILNHGRAYDAEQRSRQSRQRMLEQARWFVAQGFVVLVPTRIGYGATSDFDPEWTGSCSNRYLDASEMAVQQNKKSPSKRGMHRSHDFLTNPPLAVEPTSGEAHLRHHISPNGFYRGKKILKTKVDA